VQEAVIRAGRAPKRAQDPDFTGPLNYAYHFDATSLAAWLRQMAQARGCGASKPPSPRPA
jgi:hypothetical protein